LRDAATFCLVIDPEREGASCVPELRLSPLTNDALDDYALFSRPLPPADLFATAGGCDETP
jgi:hypothetical protein